VNNVHHGLRDLLTDEPPFILRPDEAITSGRRRRRQRLVGTTVLTGAAAVVTVGTFSMLAGAPASRPATVAFGAPTAAAGDDTAGTDDTGDTGDTSSVYYRVARAHTPAGWSIKDGHLDPAFGFWANVDDGVHGPGRLGLWHSPSGLLQHPCSEEAFVDGAVRCTETMLDSDTRLVVRSVSRSNPVNTIMVVIVHTDGSGVAVADDNATWPDGPPAGTITTPDQRRTLAHGTIASPEPLYAMDSLVTMAKTLDAATR
jgi:hypothetical protein